MQDYWVASSIKEITKNELYHGVRVWNRTQKLLNPTEGSNRKRVRPQSEWVRVEVPSLQIVSDELWQQVQNVNQRMKDKIYGRRQGGLNRTAASRGYLFSGIMYCGLCSGKFSVIVGGQAPKVRYGCTNHRRRNACANGTTILRNRLESQLISAISKNLLDPRLEEERIQEFRKQLEARIALEEKLAAEGSSNRPKLEAERSDLEKQARHLVDAISQHGYSPFLSAQLAGAESRLAEIERSLSAKTATKLPTFTDEQIRGFLRKECNDFCELLKGDPETARREIQKQIKKLVMTPKETPNGTVFEVSGDVELLRTGDALDESPLEGTAQQDMINFMGWLRKQPLPKRRNSNPDRTYANKVGYVAIFLKTFSVSRLLKKSEYPQYEEKMVTAHSDEELDFLYSHADAERRFLLDFDLNSGFRDGELSHAEYTDLVGNTLEVKRKPHLGWKPKKHHCRKVTVSQKFADAFRARGKKSETSLVFLNEAGKPNQHLLRDLQALTPNDKPFHTELHKLRKTWATRLAHAGMSLDVLQKRLGHKNLSTTQKYLADVDLSSKEHTDVVEKATYTPKPKVVKQSGTDGD